MPDVRMPDGTIIRNVPEGTTKSQLMARYGKAKPQERGLLRRVDDAVRGVADAVTLGYSDEIAAKLGEITGLGGKKGDYKGNLASQRHRDSQGGGERVLGQVIGAVAGPGSKIAAAKGLKGLVGSAIEGAAYGAGYGSGSAKEGERLQGAKSGAALGAAGGVAGRAVGAAGARLLRGAKVSPQVRELADAGVVMTPGRRGGKIKRTWEESVLGSLPFVKAIPRAANERSIEQLNVAVANQALETIGVQYPMNTPPGHEFNGKVQQAAYDAYDNAVGALNLQDDRALTGGVASILKTGPAKVGPLKDQLNSLIQLHLDPLLKGPISGPQVRALMSDLRKDASKYASSASANERGLGEELWRLNDQLDQALVRQNGHGATEAFKNAREAVTRVKRFSDATARAKGGIASPGHFAAAMKKRGFGTTTDKVSRGEARMQKLADSAHQVLPDITPNSGTAERVAGLAGLGGPGAIGAMVDPTMGVAAGLTLGGYTPGLDRILQNLALNRPDLFVRGGNALTLAGPALGSAGAVTAVNQGR